MVFRVHCLLPHRTFALLAALASLALLLGACGAPATTASTTVTTTADTATTIPTTPAATATTATSIAPTAIPHAAPTVAPTPTSQPVGVLPAALIYNMGGQLYRLDVDGKTTTKLTDEQPLQPDAIAITEFDVSPADGSLIYLTQQIGADHRTTQSLIWVAADGTNRRVLREGMYATMPRFSPDGTQIAFGVISDVGGAAQGLDGGVYLMPTSGGTPRLVQANDPFDVANPNPKARAYIPRGWSPDGSLLVLSAVLPASELCETTIKDLRRDMLLQLAAPEGTVTGCGAGVWSADSRSVYLPLYEPGMFGAFAGLAEVDVVSGALTQRIGNRIDDSYIVINGLRPAQHDTFLGFVAMSDTPFPSEPEQREPRYTLHEIGLDGRLTALRSDSQLVRGRPLWAPDLSGAVIPSGGGQTPQQILVWVPADARPPVELVMGEFFGEVRWGR